MSYPVKAGGKIVSDEWVGLKNAGSQRKNEGSGSIFAPMGWR